ncbi:MAG: hypothetical protein V4660_09770 [Pseudomonadota bacterium]
MIPQPTLTKLFLNQHVTVMMNVITLPGVSLVATDELFVIVIFWYDMEDICNKTFPDGWQFIERGYCQTVIHAWMTAVELAPGAFDNGQAWVRDRCSY